MKVPEEVARLTRLQTLNAAVDVDSHEIPRSVTTLPRLKFLHVTGGNCVTQLPLELGRMPSLSSLQLHTRLVYRDQRDARDQRMLAHDEFATLMASLKTLCDVRDFLRAGVALDETGSLIDGATALYYLPWHHREAIWDYLIQVTEPALPGIKPY